MSLVKPTQTPGPWPPVPFEPVPRGSILIFALVMLVLLAAMGTAFMLAARLESHATANALKNAQADQVSEAALNHAMRLLHEATVNYSSFSPDGVFINKYATGYIYPYCTSTITTAPYRSPLRAIEGYGTDMTVEDTRGNANGHAWLATASQVDIAVSDAGTPQYYESAAANFFTDNRLSHFATFDVHKKTNFAGGPEHVGLARKFYLASVPSSVSPALEQGLPSNAWDDFYAANPKVKTLPRLTALRGEYFIWIADVDGKLYANPQSWELYPSTVITSTTNGAHAAAVENNTEAARNICKTVNDYAGMTLPFDTTANFNPFWTRTTAYNSHAEIWGLLKPSTALTNADYYMSRYGLDRYFTTSADTTGSIKSQQAALNINTAPYETIYAALSRIPLVPGFNPTQPAKTESVANDYKARALAARICAKRPFVCRIDFEDFLAAHANTKEPTSAADIDVLRDASYAIVPTTPVGKIYLAIAKRDYSTLPLSSLLEIPGVPDTNTEFGWLRSTTPSTANSSQPDGPTPVQARFEFFRLPDAQAPLFNSSKPEQNPMLSETAFNNICNSVSGDISSTVFAKSFTPALKYGYSFYSRDPNQPLTGALKLPTDTAGKMVYSALGSDKQYDIANHLTKWCATCGTSDATNTTFYHGGYYEFHWNYDDVQELPTGGTGTGPTDPVISAGVDGVLSTPALAGSDDSAAGNIVQVGADLTAQSTIHGTLHPYGLGTPEKQNTDAPYPDRSISPATRESMGAVSWSPRFCFRSRFYMLYVLAHDLRPGLVDDGTGKKVLGMAVGSTRRVEALYDAQLNQILWRRQPLTEKRALSDP